MKINKLSINKNFVVTTAMIVGTLLYCFAVVFILDLGEFYAGGVTGVAQLMTRIFGNFGIHISKSILIGLFNIPLFIIGFRGVSKRFAYLSVGSIVVQVIAVYGFEYMRDNLGMNIFYNSLGSEKLILAIFGGLVCGIGAGISLRFGASTGGMDILSQYLAFNKNVSFTKVSLALDIVIIIFGGLVAGDVTIAVYTIIRLIIYILVLDRIHTVYNFMKIRIVTTKKEELRVALISKFNHGITIYDAIGGYTNEQRWVIETIVSSFETGDYKAAIKEIDPNAFISFTAVKSIDGHFNKNVIA